MPDKPHTERRRARQDRRYNWSEVSSIIDREFALDSKRACEADLLNTELRENYGGTFQVGINSDWRPAFKALVDGARYGTSLEGKMERDQLQAKLDVALEALDYYAHGGRCGAARAIAKIKGMP